MSQVKNEYSQQEKLNSIAPDTFNNIYSASVQQLKNSGLNDADIQPYTQMNHEQFSTALKQTSLSLEQQQNLTQVYMASVFQNLFKTMGQVEHTQKQLQTHIQAPQKAKGPIRSAAGNALKNSIVAADSAIKGAKNAASTAVGLIILAPVLPIVLPVMILTALINKAIDFLLDCIFGTAKAIKEGVAHGVNSALDGVKNAADLMLDVPDLMLESAIKGFKNLQEKANAACEAKPLAANESKTVNPASDKKDPKPPRASRRLSATANTDIELKESPAPKDNKVDNQEQAGQTSSAAPKESSENKSSPAL